MNDKKKVHIGGALYGAHNIGDESILYSMVREFGKNYQISVASYGSEWLLKYFPDTRMELIHAIYAKSRLGLSVVPRTHVLSNWKKVMEDKKVLLSADAYICGGGTILSDCPWHSLKTVEYAGHLGRKVILWGVGMADGVDKASKHYIQEVLNQNYVSKIYTRDEFVWERLKKIGVKREKLAVSYDPAIMLSGMECDLKAYMPDKFVERLYSGWKNVCISLSGESDIASKTPIGEICIFIKRLLKKEKYNIYLIPTGCGTHCRDKELMRKVEKECASEHVMMIDKEFEPEHLIYFLKFFSFSVSSRLHLNIFSACAGIPSIGLIRNSKITDFAEIFDFPVLQMTALTADSLLEMVRLVEDKEEFYKVEIPRKVADMRECQYNAIREVIDKKILL